MSLEALFLAVADCFDGALRIERAARAALLDHAGSADWDGATTPLPLPYLDVMTAPDAHPACATIAATPLPWAPPVTSQDPLYAAHSTFKSHVELLGPDGLVRCETVRLGLYGLLPGNHYGLRTHPAEEVFVMLAGSCWWKWDTAAYVLKHVGDRVHHPSMLPHATKSADDMAFLSSYVWTGDVSTDGYSYKGLPDA